MKIIAAVARDRSGPFALEELDLEQPRDDEVAVRIAGTGICHTHLAVRAGRAETLRQAVDCLALLGSCGLIGGPPPAPRSRST